MADPSIDRAQPQRTKSHLSNGAFDGARTIGSRQRPIRQCVGAAEGTTRYSLTHSGVCVYYFGSCVSSARTHEILFVVVSCPTPRASMWLATSHLTHRSERDVSIKNEHTETTCKSDRG